jgi:hypothetical protein
MAKQYGKPMSIPDQPHMCDICGKQSVVRDNGAYHCLEHHADWCKGASEESMKKIQESLK